MIYLYIWAEHVFKKTRLGNYACVWLNTPNAKHGRGISINTSGNLHACVIMSNWHTVFEPFSPITVEEIDYNDISI